MPRDSSSPLSRPRSRYFPFREKTARRFERPLLLTYPIVNPRWSDAGLVLVSLAAAGALAFLFWISPG